MKSRLALWTLMLVVISVPVTGFAHPGSHAHPHTDQPLPFTLDHLVPLVVIVLGVLAVYRLYRVRS